MNFKIILLAIFGVFLTVGIFKLTTLIRSKWNFPLLNPVMLSIVGIIIILKITGLDFEDYNHGGNLLSFFLGPSIVALGVFFFEKYKEVKKNLYAFLTSIFVGGITGIVSVVVILLLFQVPQVIINSLAAKSVTTPIAIEITKSLNGIPEITAGIVIAVGVFGNAIGPFFLRSCGIYSTKAVGTALGTAAHGIGTAKAMEIDKLAGVYSGLAMCVNGVITAIFAPLILEILQNYGIFIADLG